MTAVVRDFTESAIVDDPQLRSAERRPALIDCPDLAPISWCDPSHECAEPISPWRFMLAGAVSIAVVGALLITLLIEGMP